MGGPNAWAIDWPNGGKATETVRECGSGDEMLALEIDLFPRLFAGQSYGEALAAG